MSSVYDRALAEVGDNNKFQKRYDVLYNLIFVAIWVMVYMNVVLALVIVPHSCALPPKPDNVSDYQWKLEHLPLSDDSKGEQTFSSCFMYKRPGESNETVECNGYVYDKTWYGSTAATEYNWVCDRELYVADVFAYSRIAEVVGSVILGWFGDVFGRRLTYIISLTLTVLGRSVTLLSGNSFALFVTGCVILSIPSWMSIQCPMVVSMEISSAERRTWINVLRSVGWTVGMCVLPFLYWMFRDWKLFVVITTVCMLPFLLFCWKNIESPRWLWLDGKPRECVRILKYIAKVNGRRLEADTEKELLNSRPPKDPKGLGPLALFSSWSLGFNTVLQLLLWITLTISYTVLILSPGEGSTGNPFLEFAWQAAAEMPGNFLGAWLADRIGRRYAGASSYIFAALFWMLLAVRSNTTCIWLQSWWAGIILTMLLRLATTVVYYVINLFNMELYPTCLRQSGMSLGNVVSSGSSATAPYILYIGRRVDARLPGAILTVISLIGTLSFMLLPETLNRTLPETIEDAKNFGKGERRYFSVKTIHISKKDVA